MKAWRLAALFAALLLFGTGCLGRGLTIRDAAPGDLTQIQGQTLDTIYFVPFDMKGLELKGDHGDAATAAANKAKWFSHLVVGAQDALNEQMPGVRVALVGERPAQLDIIEEKYALKVDVVSKVPKGAYVVRGSYTFSEEISGAARAMLGVMVGKSWTRARTRVEKDGVAIYGCTIDGKYMGTAYSWGYETLGANEALGKGIAEVIEAIQKGVVPDIE